MPSLSLAMIVKNEEARLSHCLGSVRGLVDEMVVVDTGSNDGTVALAESFGARVGHFVWCNDFAAARNAALDLCTGEWVLVLDADEAVDPLDHPVIRGAMERKGPPAFRVTLRNYLPHGAMTLMDETPRRNTTRYTEGSSCAYYADHPALRLCRRLPGLAYRGVVHELLDPFFQERGMKIGTCRAVVHHFGKMDRGGEVSKQPVYLQMARREAEQHPGELQAHFNLMIQAQQVGELEEALRAAQACLRLNPNSPRLVSLTAAQVLRELGRPKEALPWLEKLLKAFPDHGPCLLLRAQILSDLGQEGEALTVLRRAVRRNPDWALLSITLAEKESKLGEFEAARATLLESIRHHPGQELLLEALVRLDLDHDRRDQALGDAALAIRQCPSGGNGIWHWVVGTELWAAGRLAHARAAVQDGLRVFPGHEGLQALAVKLGDAS
ncbi:MAG: glycosyltransferase [Acidobacteria bacterium]|nr:glycosyltransferase [Acidobacteriota bacterium]